MGFRSKLFPFVQLLRPQQWYKNLLIFAGVVFSLNLFNYPMYPKLFLGFMVMCAISGAAYVINDIIDLRKDQIHPEKSRRPIAAGKISSKTAVILAITLSVSSILVAFILSVQFLILTLLLAVTQLAYSLVLKKIPIVDMLAIAFGYVWRAIAGVVLIQVSMRYWFPMGVFFLSLLLAAGKRKSDLELLGTNASMHRDVYKAYNSDFLNYMVTFSSLACLIFYAFYSVNTPVPGDDRLLPTVPVVAFILMRYMFVLLSKNSPAPRNPELLIFDIPIAIGLVMWFILFIVLLYAGPLKF